MPLRPPFLSFSLPENSFWRCSTQTPRSSTSAILDCSSSLLPTSLVCSTRLCLATFADLAFPWRPPCWHLRRLRNTHPLDFLRVSRQAHLFHHPVYLSDQSSHNCLAHWHRSVGFPTVQTAGRTGTERRFLLSNLTEGQNPPKHQKNRHKYPTCACFLCKDA